MKNYAGGIIKFTKKKNQNKKSVKKVLEDQGLEEKNVKKKSLQCE